MSLFDEEVTWGERALGVIFPPYGVYNSYQDYEQYTAPFVEGVTEAPENFAQGLGQGVGATVGGTVSVLLIAVVAYAAWTKG